MGVSSLPKIVTPTASRLRFEPRSSASKSSTLTTRLPSHPYCLNLSILQKTVCVQLPTSAVNVTLLALVTERRAAAPLLLSAVQQSINTSCPPGTQQQTRNSSVRRANDETDRQTDGQTDRRTPDRYIDLAPHTMQAVSEIRLQHINRVK